MDFDIAEIFEPVRLSAGVYSVTAVQSLCGVPVFESALTFTYRNNALSRVDGTYYPAGEIVRVSQSACISCADALVAPCLPSKRQWGYRNKIELGAQWDAKGTFNLGFHQEGDPNVQQALACPLAHDAIAKAPKALRGALRFLQGSDDLGIFRVGVRTSVRTRETEVALWTRPSGFPRAAAAKMLKSSLKATSVVRVVADPGKARKIKGLEVLDGKGIWTEQLCGARYVAHAPSFFQVNTAQAEKLVEQAVLALGGSIGDARDALRGKALVIAGVPPVNAEAYRFHKPPPPLLRTSSIAHDDLRVPRAQDS